jgi:hypothetical protein
MLLRNFVLAAVVFVITSSNIALHWGNDYLVCVLALVLGFLATSWVLVWQKHRAEKKFERFYARAPYKDNKHGNKE